MTARARCPACGRRTCRCAGVPRLVAAREAFLRYGDHEPGCLYDGPAQDRALLSVEGCTCGFTAALRAAVGEGEG